MKFLTTTLALTLSLTLCYAGGPWTPWQFKGIFIGSFNANIASHMSIRSDKLDLPYRVTDITAPLYVEFGLTDELAIVGSFPLKYVQTGEQLTDVPSDAAPQTGSLFGLGNTAIELKYKFYQKKKLAIAGGVQVDAPSTPAYEAATGLRLGYDCWGIGPTVHFGVPLDNGMYLQFGGRMNFRTNNYSDELWLTAEVGGTLKKTKRKVNLALMLQWRESLQNGSRTNPGENLYTALYLNNQEWVAYTLKCSWQYNTRLGMNVAVGGGAYTQYIFRTPAVTVGITYDWHRPKEKLKNN